MNLLAAIDLTSDAAAEVADQGVSFAMALGARLDLVHIGGGRPEAELLHALVARLDPAVRGSAFRLDGDPESLLLRAVAPYDVLVLGARRHGPLERFILGSFAARIIRHASCPVYVPRPGAVARFPAAPRVAVAVALEGPNPGWVLGKAGVWAQHLGGRVDALYSDVSDVSYIRDPAMREAARHQWQRQHEPARVRLEALLEAIPVAHRGQARLLEGSTDNALVAASRDIDLLVVGTRSRPGLAGKLLGSVAEHVVTHAHCAVLTVPSNMLDVDP